MYAINLFSSPPFPLTWLRCSSRSLNPNDHFICHHQCHKHGLKNKIHLVPDSQNPGTHSSSSLILLGSLGNSSAPTLPWYTVRLWINTKILCEMISFYSRFWEGPSLRPPSKCAQRHVLVPPGHPRHHAALHPPLPPHVPPHVHPEEESTRHRPQDRLVLLFGGTIAAFALFLSGWRDTVMWVSVWSVICVNVYEIKQECDMSA